eukprot:11220329-Lingulodinium_polyedra.AAC.1
MHSVAAIWARDHPMESEACREDLHGPSGLFDSVGSVFRSVRSVFLVVLGVGQAWLWLSLWLRLRL